MKIGIIGNGKMGSEIFRLFFEGKHEIAVYCIENEDGFRKKIERQLKKLLRAEIIDLSEYEKKMSMFSVSNDMSSLSGCGLIIEAVTENLNIKKEIFEKVQEYVDDDCILATNTSSIPLSDIFEMVENKERCAGLHFFYPVMLNKTVEINLLERTSSKTLNVLKSLTEDMVRKCVVFKQPYHMYLNRLLSVLTTHAYFIFRKSNFTLEQIDEIVKEQFMTFGLFETVDSVGIDIIRESLKNFMEKKYEDLFNPFYEDCGKLMESGYFGRKSGMGIIDFYKNRAYPENQVLFSDINVVPLSLFTLVFNEITDLTEHSELEGIDVLNAACDALGIQINQPQIFDKYDVSEMDSCLSKFYEMTNYPVYYSHLKNKSNQCIL